MSHIGTGAGAWNADAARDDYLSYGIGEEAARELDLPGCLWVLAEVYAKGDGNGEKRIPDPDAGPAGDECTVQGARV